MIFVDMIAAFLVAAMSGLGIGGGGLLVIYLTLIKGVEQIEAQGINLMFFLFASGASLLVHLNKRKINFGILGVMVLFGIIGCIFGSLTANVADPMIVRKIFGTFLVITGAMTIFKNFKKIKKSS